MATREAKATQAQKLNAATNAFLQELNSGPLSFAQLLGGLREADGESLTQFAARLGVSRQHLHQLEAGQKRVSPERAVRFAQILGHSDVYFVKVALQDMLNDAGVSATVEVNAA